QLRELEASVAAITKEDSEKEGEKADMEGASVTPATTKKRSTRKTTKRAQAAIDSERKNPPKEQDEPKEEVLQSIETAAELKERVNGASKPASKRRGTRKEVKEGATEQKDEPEESEQLADESEKSQDHKESVKQGTDEESKDADNEEEPPSSSQKENLKPYVFQTPKKPSNDSDELPYSLAEMETPSRAETDSLIARAKQMVTTAAAAVTPERLTNFGSPLKNEVKTVDGDIAAESKGEGSKAPSADKDLTSGSTFSKKRKADDFETDDKEIDSLIDGDDYAEDETDSGADRRPAKRTRLQMVEEIRRERVRHRGLVGLITVVGIA
ncbi:hypothetical protein KEM54_004134, partial [Ascosphaera aggregata]